jgi:hypothetical protein
MEGVPVHDPLPTPRASTKRRFWRIFRLLLTLSAVIAAIAVLLVSDGDSALHINMLIATAVGIFFTVLLGTSLMTLVFLSADTGHDEAAAAQGRSEEEE